MKVTFAPSERGINGQRIALDQLGQYIARAWMTDDSPAFAGEVMDVRIRYCEYGEVQDSIVVSPWNRDTATRTAPDCVVYIDRLHVY